MTKVSLEREGPTITGMTRYRPDTADSAHIKGPRLRFTNEENVGDVGLISEAPPILEPGKRRIGSETREPTSSPVAILGFRV